MTVEDAMKTLKVAFQEDPEYAFGWHSNIAMAATDANVDVSEKLGIPLTSYSDFNRAGNDAASRFMKLAFDVETSQDMLE